MPDLCFFHGEMDAAVNTFPSSLRCIAVPFTMALRNEVDLQVGKEVVAIRFCDVVPRRRVTASWGIGHEPRGG